MNRMIPIMFAVTAACLVSSFVTVREFASAGPTIGSPDVYGLVDPSANGPGNPGFVFQHNMLSVRRVGLGQYCLRSRVHYDDGPVALTTVDGTLPRGLFALAVSDSRAAYCDHSKQEYAVATFMIIHGRARPSNAIRFVGDSLG